MKELKKYIDGQIEWGIPYLDVIAKREHEELLRYYNAKGGSCGNEKLFMYSCTKPLTVACAIKLVEDGKLSLDTPVEDIIPAYRDVYLEEDGVRRAPKTKMNVRHLFTMTAGLTYNGAMYPIDEAYRNRGEKSPTLAIAESFAKAPLMSEPGERFRYSLCHDLLGAVIETVSGMKFSEYMKKTILDPLGMHDTYFTNASNDETAELYASSEDGVISHVEKVNSLVYRDGYESGGAGLISTVSDYAKFGAMLASGGVSADGSRILSESSVRALWQKQVSAVSIESGFTCVQGEEYGYGLGVRTRTEPTEWGLPVGEFGWDGAAGSYLMVDPVNKISVVVGMHVRGWPPVFRGKHLEIVKHIYRILGIK